jgi:predicted MFS family arabinose efflux permease
MANGLGGVAGGLLMTVASRWVRRRFHRLLGLTVLADGLAYVAYAVAPSLAAATVALTLAGLAFIPALICYRTVVQLASADAVRGRVLSIFSTGIAAGMLASLSCTGALIDLWGVRPVIGAAAIMILACGLLCCALVRVMPAPEADAAAETSRPAPAARGDAGVRRPRSSSAPVAGA